MPQTATLAAGAGTRPGTVARLAVLIAATAVGIATSVAVVLVALLLAVGAT